MGDKEKLLRILRDIYPGGIEDALETVADYMLACGVTFAADNKDGRNELQEGDLLDVMQRPVAATLTREQWHTISDWLKYGADHHHAKMLETLAVCQDQKLAGKIAREHEMAMQKAESVRQIVEAVLYPAPEQEEAQDNAGG